MALPVLLNFDRRVHTDVSRIKLLSNVKRWPLVRDPLTSMPMSHDQKKETIPAVSVYKDRSVSRALRMTGHDSTQARAKFAERLRVEAPIRSDALVRGVSKVAREQFVGPGPWKILRPSEIQKGYETTPDDNPRHIYDTVLVALDHTRNLNNGEPSSLLRWLDSLDLNRGDTFLHVGCGVGYYTAIAAEAVGSEGRVTGIEIDAQLARQAERNLGSYANVRVVAANGGSEIPSTFDAIFINAGCTHPQPAWLDQLAIGGLLGVLDACLDGRIWIMGDDYSIADIAILGWVRNLITFYEARDLVAYDQLEHVPRWLERTLARPAVQRGLQIPRR
jgi:protein-L-isoaspartate O-methyltransferase